MTLRPARQIVNEAGGHHIHFFFYAISSVKISLCIFFFFSLIFMHCIQFLESRQYDAVIIFSCIRLFELIYPAHSNCRGQASTPFLHMSSFFALLPHDVCCVFCLAPNVLLVFLIRCRLSYSGVLFRHLAGPEGRIFFFVFPRDRALLSFLLDSWNVI